MTSTETQDLFWYLKKKDWKGLKKQLKNFNKMTLDDTFKSLICAIKGHTHPVVAIDWASEINDKYIIQTAYACKRCRKYLSNYNHIIEPLSYKDTVFYEYLMRDYSNNIQIIKDGRRITFKLKKRITQNSSLTFDEWYERFFRDTKSYLEVRLTSISYEEVSCDIENSKDYIIELNFLTNNEYRDNYIK